MIRLRQGAGPLAPCRSRIIPALSQASLRSLPMITGPLVTRLLLQFRGNAGPYGDRLLDHSGALVGIAARYVADFLLAGRNEGHHLAQLLADVLDRMLLAGVTQFAVS